MSNTRTHLETNVPNNYPDEPLLRLLIAEATRRGDTLQSLSSHLGVTYTRLTQWRRRQAEIKNARREVHERAATYLQLPLVVVFILGGVVTLPDFVYPGPTSLQFKLQQELDSMQQDPLFGGFVPAEIATASAAVQLFVVFMYAELRAKSSERSDRPWLSLLEALMKTSESLLNTEDGKPASPPRSSGIF